jgi:hypothetical protein
MDQGIGLAEFVTALRSELKVAQENAKGEDLQFSVEDIQLEVKVFSESSDKVKSGVKFWVLNAGGEMADKASLAQTLKLQLKLVPDAAGGGSCIAGEVS